MSKAIKHDPISTSTAKFKLRDTYAPGKFGVYHADGVIVSSPVMQIDGKYVAISDEIFVENHRLLFDITSLGTDGLMIQVYEKTMPATLWQRLRAGWLRLFEPSACLTGC